MPCLRGKETFLKINLLLLKPFVYICGINNKINHELKNYENGKIYNSRRDKQNLHRGRNKAPKRITKECEKLLL